VFEIWYIEEELAAWRREAPPPDLPDDVEILDVQMWEYAARPILWPSRSSKPEQGASLDFFNRLMSVKEALSIVFDRRRHRVDRPDLHSEAGGLDATVAKLPSTTRFRPVHDEDPQLLR
jgi:hypothetical protein